MQEQLTPAFGDYELIDTGDFEKLERFGRYVTRRPEPQAIWRRTLSEEEWRRAADASFLRDTRSEERGEWRLGPEMPRAGRWITPIRGCGCACGWDSPRSSTSASSLSRPPTGISSTTTAGRWRRAEPLRWGLRAESAGCENR